MSDGPVVQVVPPLRCQHRNEKRPRILCGRLARWMRPAPCSLCPAAKAPVARVAATTPTTLPLSALRAVALFRLKRCIARFLQLCSPNNDVVPIPLVTSQISLRFGAGKMPAQSARPLAHVRDAP